MEPPPFSDLEKRFVLSEAIKTSSVPVEKLLTFVVESDVQPKWSEILMPHGRNLNQCQHAWDTLRAGPPSASLPVPAPERDQERKRKSAPEGLEPFQTAPQPKRRQSGADTMIRIQPKPSSNGSPLSFSSPAATQPKKRGRPSKADVEARNAAAIARGEVIPPQRTPVARDPVGGNANAESATGGVFGGLAAIAPMIAPGPAPETSMSTSFAIKPLKSAIGDAASKKKRGRPDNSKKEPKQGEGTFPSTGQPFAQVEVAQPPASKATEPPALPPRSREEGIAAPSFPGIAELLSPEPQRLERPDTSAQ